MAGDSRRRRQPPRRTGGRFNPRPPISWRATRVNGGYIVLNYMFQSTPTNFMAGDDDSTSVQRADAGVSIHAHQFHGGRPTAADDLPGLVDVSIHAHQFHGGRRLAALVGVLVADVSIHAHQFHGGRRAAAAVPAMPASGFNPRPPISWRATPVFRNRLLHRPVSIHAHQFHGGRRFSWPATASTGSMFQSTPTNFMAGDA